MILRETSNKERTRNKYDHGDFFKENFLLKGTAVELK